MKINVQEEFKAYLKQEDRFIPKIFAKIEKATSVNREHVAIALAAILSLYLIVGQRAALLCNAIGVAYPIFVSLKSIQSTDNQSNTQWLTYWSLFGTFSLFDVTIGSWPLYWLFKCVGLLALSLPVFRGAERVYVLAVAPAFNRLFPSIDNEQNQPKAKSEQTKEEGKTKSFDNHTPPETPTEP